jgi:hypothetical protein
MKPSEKTVFISYRRGSSGAWPQLIFQDLTQHGYDVFLDTSDGTAGDFEQFILGHISTRAHFLLLLSQTTLDRCSEPDDFVRKEIERALASRRNIVPMYLDGFNISDSRISSLLTGSLASLKQYSGVRVPLEYFSEVMSRLRKQYLISIGDVPHPISYLPGTTAPGDQNSAPEQGIVAKPSSAQSASGTEPAGRASPDEWALRIALSPLHPILLQNAALTNRMLEEPPSSIDDDLFASLIAVVAAMSKRRRKVEVISAFSPSFTHSVRTPEEFTAALLADHVLQPTKIGYLKWLILETSRIVMADAPSRANADRIWEVMIDRYLDERSREYRPELQDLLCQAIRGSLLEDKPNRLYPFFQFLWGALSEHQGVATRLVEFLRAARARLGDSKPHLLKTLIVLLGQGERLINLSNAVPYQPDVVTVPIGAGCNYEFEAMRTPITNHQFMTLCGARGMEDHRLYEPHLLGPWEWQSSAGQQQRYPQVVEEMRAILESCELIAHKPGYIWRVPTVTEWLRLSGCDDQCYPWGEAEPTPAHANLNFGQGVRRIKPVGSYPKGQSKYGTDDCCGNIHELAWASKREHLPESGRLMGGCFLTRSERLHSSCRRIRLLSKREPDLRRNVGLRLVRVLDDADRWTSLQEVLSKLEVDVDG